MFFHEFNGTTLDKNKLIISIILTSIYIFAFCHPCFSSYGTELEKIQSYTDSNFATLLEKYGICGGVGTVVLKDRCITFAGGYIDKNKLYPMNPTTTAVPVASISKLFTTIAILQLYEQGKIDLDTDLNIYLYDFQINSPFSKPLTVHNLLTHTAGFDDKFLGMGAPTLDKVLPLGKYLSQNLPEIVYPSGYTISYSNHGFALLGHIVENVSKLAFKDYMNKYILEPLEMTHSTFDGSTPPDTTRAIGYYHVLNAEKDAYQDYAQTPPASSLCTTAEDFSHFLKMILNDGEFKNKQILKPATVKMMLLPRYKFNPLLPGYSCAWEENYILGKRVFQHSGLTWGFSSICIVIPEIKFGLFLTINSDKSTPLWELVNSLLNNYIITTSSLRKIRNHTSLVPPEIYKQITGFYRFNRYCRSDIFRLSTIFPTVTHEIYIKGNPEERKIYIYPLEFLAKSWTVEEIGDFLWGKKSKSRITSSTPTMTIARGLRLGEWQIIFGNNAYESIPFWDTKPFKYALLFGSVSIFLLNLIRVIWRILLSISKRKRDLSISNTELISITYLIYIILFIVYLFAIIEPQTLGYGIPLGLFILIIFSYILLLMTILTTIRCLANVSPSLSKNVIQLLTLLGCYALIFLMYNTNILDFKMNFLKFLNLRYL